MQLNPNCRVQPRPQDLSLVLGLGPEEAKGTSAEGKGEVLETRLFTVLFFKATCKEDVLNWLNSRLIVSV